ncbi:SAGA complex subunit Sgf73 [Coemansia brasiliensis]|uniref:SAGA complex subunit Sgf73 n=1 Tax=Coemansia brasiliensis TaxID=2650707 RepID=A0A9W8M1F8_9FUNG|nr:SAGA complex subunit Sgf73 [Coemansia brasiliensis]
MSGGQRAHVLRRGHSAGGNGSSPSSNSGANGNNNSNGGLGTAYMESFTDEQRRTLKRRIEALRVLEQEVEALRAERMLPEQRYGVAESMATAGALAVFGEANDWAKVSEKAVGQFGRAARLTWDMLKKAVAEEDKYQSKKNWSSTKGRGNRKAPVARRLDAEVLKKLGVYPLQQFPVLARCDSCGRQINAHFLREHQEQNCSVSMREDKKTGIKRAAGEAELEPPAKAIKLTKKERMRLDKERREREREERREQQRIDKERKKREREEKRERDQAKARLPLDLDRQCGVVVEPGAAPCTRSLTCKTHSMAMKRAVRGRSNMFDALLQAHLAKSRSAAAAKNAAASRSAAKSGSAAAVRNATAIALAAGTLDDNFFDESDSDRDSDSETELVIDGIRCSRGQPLAVRPSLLPRRRHHYLRVRDLFYDALRPSMGSETPDALTTS